MLTIEMISWMIIVVVDGIHHQTFNYLVLKSRVCCLVL